MLFCAAGLKHSDHQIEAGQASVRTKLEASETCIQKAVYTTLGSQVLDTLKNLDVEKAEEIQRAYEEEQLWLNDAIIKLKKKLDTSGVLQSNRGDKVNFAL